MKTSYGTILVLAAAVVMLFTALPCWAVESDEENIWSDDKPRYMSRRMELTEEVIERVMTRLAETDPEKAEELKRLRKKDPEKFKAEIRKAMRERFAKIHGEQKRRKGATRSHSGEDKPSMVRGGRFRPAKKGARTGIGPAMRRESHAEYLEWLEKNYPQEAKKLAGLKGKRPEVYEERVGHSLRKYRRIFEAEKENPELAEVLKEDLKLKKKRDKLLRKIRRVSDNEERQELIGQLEQVISSRFDLILRRKQIEYKRLHKQLERLKERIKKSEAKIEKWKDPEFKNSNIEARIDELTAGIEGFKWD